MFKYLKQFAFEEKDRYIFMAFQEENLAIVNIYIYIYIYIYKVGI